MEESIEEKQQECSELSSLVQCLKKENEKLKTESELFVKKTEDKLKNGQNALEIVGNLEAEVFDLKCKLGNAQTEIENSQHSLEKSKSITFEISTEIERIKNHSNGIKSEMELNQKLCEENGELRRKMKNMKEFCN